MKLEKEMLSQIILINLIRNLDYVNGLLNKNLNKLTYQKICQMVYVHRSQKIYRVSVQTESR